MRARSDLQLVVLYERSGQTQAALDATHRVLTAWAKADGDLPELRDARARFALLSGDAPLR